MTRGTFLIFLAFSLFVDFFFLSIDQLLFLQFKSIINICIDNQRLFFRRT